MDLWFVIAAPIVVAVFLGWYLWAASKRKATIKRDHSDDPRDTWDALSAGDDPTSDSR